MVRLDINGVHFSYGSKKALDNIEFSVSNGEVVGILGENGSGKTTLLNCINTEYRPTQGCVMISDYSPDAVFGKRDTSQPADVNSFSDSEKSRIIATVEQNSARSFPFTVMETVRMGRYSRTGMFDDDDEAELEIICNAMEEAGVLEFADRGIDELSGGEWRRVMIAQALAQEPDILLLDEPTLHLDISHQFDLMEMCRDIVKGRNILIVIVTHDLQLAARYCDRIVLMQKSKVISIGDTKDVITERMIADVFHMESRIAYCEEDGGATVTLLRRVRN